MVYRISFTGSLLAFSQPTSTVLNHDDIIMIGGPLSPSLFLSSSFRRFSLLLFGFRPFECYAAARGPLSAVKDQKPDRSGKKLL